MAFTDSCDLFSSFHEDGFNRIIEHVRRQRPSLFNYATADIARNEKLLCRAIAVQLADLQIDFHPGKSVALPPELNPPLKEQRLAIKLGVCGGIGCPDKELLDRLIPPPKVPGRNTDGKDPREQTPVTALPTRKLHCFCLEAYVTGGVRIATYNGKPYLEPFLDGFEIVDIKPEGLENSLECYIGVLLRLVVLPGLRVLLERAPLNLTQGATDLFPQPTNVTLSATPVSAAVPNNPAIEDDQLKVFIKAEVN